MWATALTASVACRSRRSQEPVFGHASGDTYGKRSNNGSSGLNRSSNERKARQ